MNFAQLELRHLRYFLAVADAAHFTRAAARLHVTQPTLSHQIRQLEGQLNLTLFERNGRRIRLTAAGEMLLPYARRAIEALEEAGTALGELHLLKRGALRVGIMQTVNACVIPEIVARFSTRHPGIRVTCSELAVIDIEAGLEAGELDLGISFLPPTRQNLQGDVLFTEELVMVVRRDHPLASRGSLPIAGLAEVPLVLLAPRYCTRQLLDRALAEAEVRPEVRVEMNSVDGILSTVRESGLPSVLPSLALCRRDEGLAAVPLTNPAPHRQVGLLWRAGSPRRLAAQAFAQVAQEVLENRRLTGNRPGNTAKSEAPPRRRLVRRTASEPASAS